MQGIVPDTRVAGPVRVGRQGIVPDARVRQAARGQVASVRPYKGISDTKSVKERGAADR